MKTRVYAIVIFSLVLSLNLFGQDAAAVDQSTREEVVRFMDLVQVRSRMTMMVDNLRVEQKRIMEQALKQAKPNATPQDIQRAEQVMDTGFRTTYSDQMVDEIMNAIVPIYQKHFSKADLDGLLAFYTSPVGQKFQSETPAITQETMQAMGDLVSKRLPEMQQAMKAQMEKMAAEDKKTNDGAGKN